jgi:hypothetical protein
MNGVQDASKNKGKRVKYFMSKFPGVKVIILLALTCTRINAQETDEVEIWVPTSYCLPYYEIIVEFRLIDGEKFTGVYLEHQNIWYTINGGFFFVEEVEEWRMLF